MTDENLLALPVGYQLNHYTIDSVLGQGGFGIVYKAHHNHLDEHVVIKEFLPVELAGRNQDTIVPHTSKSQALFSELRQRFVEEGRVLVKLMHPNIVRCRDLFEANGSAYLVMNFEDGLPFDTLLKLHEEQGSSYTESQLLQVLIPLAQGIEYVHTQGVLHRDIKPANVFIRRADNSPVLLDFGAAKQNFAEVSQSQAPFTEFYAPIDQLDVTRKTTVAIDIHAFGGLMYRAVTGQIGPRAEARSTGITIDGKDPLEPASIFSRGNYSKAFLTLIDKCLAFRPNDRPESMKEVLEKLVLLENNTHLIEEKDSTRIAQSEISQPTELNRTGKPNQLPILTKNSDSDAMELSHQYDAKQSASEGRRVSRKGIWIGLVLIAGLFFGGYQYLQTQAKLKDVIANQQLMNQIQTELKRLSYYQGKVDGEDSNETSTAIKEAQTELDLEVDGRASQGLLDKLKETQKRPFPKEVELLISSMKEIPAGKFMMGSNEGKSNENPVHQVSLSAFRLMEHEVTLAMWDACVADNGCSYRPYDSVVGKENIPVDLVSWFDINQQFIPWLNKRTAQEFRLPSEAEWEYAARAGSTTKYSWGDSIDCTRARYGYFKGEGDCGNDMTTVAVKLFQPNRFGLYDMHGNVTEWTQDRWNNNYVDAPNDGKAWQTGTNGLVVRRGGSYNHDPERLRSAYRFSATKSSRHHGVGFRLAQDSKR